MLFMASANILWAQDDDLPPPSSKPKKEDVQKDEQKAPDAKDFQGFKPKKKFDLSKFIIEPNPNLAFSQNRIDAGLSLYVGYNVWKGLFVGGGVNYYYTGIKNYAVADPTGRQVLAKFHTQNYGGGVFLQYNVWKGFFVRTKLELLGRQIPTSISFNSPTNGSYNYKVNYINKFTPALLIGGGYNMLRSKNFFMPVAIYYNLLHSVVDKQYSIYPRGFVIQLGFINLF